MTGVEVDTTKLRECGRDIMRLTSELNDVLEEMYNRIQRMPTNTKEWTGEAATKYVNLLNQEKKQYIMLKDNIYKYGKLLSDAADKFDNTINSVRK